MHRIVLAVILLAALIILAFYRRRGLSAVLVGVCGGALLAAAAGQPSGKTGGGRPRPRPRPHPRAARAPAEGDGLAPEALDREYRHWRLAREIMKVGCAPDVGQRCRVVLEGWISNHYRPPSEAEGRKYGALTGALENTAALGAALTHAGVSPAVAQRVVASVEALRDGAPPAEPGAPPEKVKLVPGGLQYRDFTLKASPRIEALVEKAGPPATVRAYLRYSSMLAGAHHWSVPSEVFEALWEQGFRNEAFASPMNSRVLGRPGGHYFSLFEDTDAPLGSLGDVFAYPPGGLRKLKGGWEVNPPFLAEVLKKAAALAVSVADKRDVFFVTKKAAAGRASPYAALERVAKASAVLPARAHAYQVEGPGGSVLREASFDTHLLYAGPRPQKEAEALLALVVSRWPSSAAAPLAPAPAPENEGGR